MGTIIGIIFHAILLKYAWELHKIAIQPYLDQYFTPKGL
jgi:hypothetical protein